MTDLQKTLPKEAPTDWEFWHKPLLEYARIPGMTIPRAVALLEENLGADYYAGMRGHLNRMAAKELKWPTLRSGIPIYRIGVVQGRYSTMLVDAKNQLIRTLVKDRITDEVDAVVELGCGVARHLLMIRDMVEHKFPNIRYYGADLSDSGLAASTVLAGLEPARNSVTFHKFNWLAPDFSFISGSPRNVLFYSCFSIEQVQYLGDDLIPAMLAVAPTVTAIHEEPIGWQLRDKNEPEASPPQIGGPIDTGLIAKMLQNKGYNADFAGMLISAHQAGAIKLEMMEVNACGDSVLIPATIAIWHKPSSQPG